MNDTDKLRKEKQELLYTLYHDFVNGVRKNSIYKSIKLVKVEGGTAFYECEAYDKEYRCATFKQMEETCEKLRRAFERYYSKVFKKYGVDNISAEIYDEYACVAGISVYSDGTVVGNNF